MIYVERNGKITNKELTVSIYNYVGKQVYSLNFIDNLFLLSIPVNDIFVTDSYLITISNDSGKLLLAKKVIVI